MMRSLRFLRPVDALVIAFALLLCVITLVAVHNVTDCLLLLAANLLSCIGIIYVARGEETNAVARAIHHWYPVPAIFLVFKEMYVIIQSLQRPDWDGVLIAADRAIFGADPTVWLANISTPWLTEVLQVSYVSYYFIMLAVGVELFVRKDGESFSYVLFVVVYGFFLSYLGYLIFPAVGPRFTLHDFGALNMELPGVWLTNGLRDFINAGESISGDAANAIAHAQRDAFPSGHAQMTLISMYLAHQFRLRSRYVLYMCGTLLIISTVYLRYHYIVDVLGGIVFMMLTVWTAPKLFRWWKRLSEDMH